MASYYVVKQNSSSFASMPLMTVAPSKPYVRVKSHGYIPLAANEASVTGPKFKIGSSVYRPLASTTESYTTTTAVNTTSSSTYTLQSTTWQWVQQGSDSGTAANECGAAVWITLSQIFQNSIPWGYQYYQPTLYGSITLGAIVTQGSWSMPFPIWAGFLTANGILATYWQRSGPLGAPYAFTWSDSAVILANSPNAVNAGLAAINSIFLTASKEGASENPSGPSSGYFTVGYGSLTTQSAYGTQAYRTSDPYSNGGNIAPADLGNGVYLAQLYGGRNWRGTTSSMNTYTTPSPALTSNYATTSEGATTVSRTVTL